MNVLIDFIEQVKMAKGYAEYLFEKRNNEGEDVETLLTKVIPGDGQSPLTIGIHGADSLYRFILGSRDPTIDAMKLELKVDPKLKPTEQLFQAYDIALDELTKYGEEHISLDEMVYHPYTKKDKPLREVIRFFVFHFIEHSGQVVRFQHHLRLCDEKV